MTPDIPNIPDYKLLKPIGRGSYGDVWLAQGVSGIYRAIKIVWRERFTEASPFEREYIGLKNAERISLSEPKQLAILHIGRNEEAGFFYYVMELADDVSNPLNFAPENYKPFTLKEHISKRRVLGAMECVNLGIELSEALKSLHDRQLVHRDVKPSNILMVNGVPKLGDIGLVADVDTCLTFVGTEGYIPPEGPGYPSADIYGLGVVLYELSTGFSRRDFPKLPHVLDERGDKRELLELNEILLRACDPLASRRYQTANELLEELLLVRSKNPSRFNKFTFGIYS